MTIIEHFHTSSLKRTIAVGRGQQWVKEKLPAGLQVGFRGRALWARLSEDIQRRLRAQLGLNKFQIFFRLRISFSFCV